MEKMKNKCLSCEYFTKNPDPNNTGIAIGTCNDGDCWIDSDELEYYDNCCKEFKPKKED